VTREAEERAATLDAAALADHRRLKRTFRLTTLLVALAGVAWVYEGDLVGALLARQGLADAEIPREFSLKNWTPAFWPSGEPVIVSFQVNRQYNPRFAADGGWSELRGMVVATADDGAHASYPSKLGWPTLLSTAVPQRSLLRSPRTSTLPHGSATPD